MLCTPTQLLHHICPCLASRRRTADDQSHASDADHDDEGRALLSGHGHSSDASRGGATTRGRDRNGVGSGYGSTSASHPAVAVAGGSRGSASGDAAKGDAPSAAADSHLRVKRIDVSKGNIDKRREHVLTHLHHLDASTLRSSSTPPAHGRGRQGTTSNSDASSPTDIKPRQSRSHARASSSSTSISSASSPPGTSTQGTVAPPTSALGRRTRRVHTSVSGKVRALHLGLRPESPPGPSFDSNQALGSREVEEQGAEAAKKVERGNEPDISGQQTRERGRPMRGRRTSSLDNADVLLKRRLASEHSLQTIHGSSPPDEEVNHGAAHPTAAACTSSRTADARSPRSRLKEAHDMSGPMVEDWDEGPAVKNLNVSDLELESGTESEREPPPVTAVGADNKQGRRR
ncbi:hypothetical protein IE81DRAFT_350614 [Ceraceosorus guamensis]|uniref:Uncharacterized protein n=1 Tax=Ceraceosorus guamensis TaxID=1522189 RepID=A0A316VRZ0_9BASI|nr:hypothetical protein IE81DRAFT_350614 [Ceraceosorus guamensis]PWN38951.1 hypothetical protein IE81DRAFT_350614 [Ceraceosorus guamensis]